VRSRRRVAACLMALAAWGAPHARAAPGADPPRVAAGRAESAIEIDGRLDEKDWKRAGVIADLTQHTLEVQRARRDADLGGSRSRSEHESAAAASAETTRRADR